MNELFLVTGTLAAFGGLAHAYLGERLLIIPLMERADLPTTRFETARLLRNLAFSDHDTKMILRGSWHFFTVVMVSLAVAFLALGSGVVGGGDWTVVRVLAGYFAVFGVLVLALLRGRHFAWLIGLGAAVTAWLGTL